MSETNCSSCDCCGSGTGSQRTLSTWLQAAGMLLFVGVAYLILKETGVFSLTSTVGDAVSLGTIFVIGLVAATSSCLAVVGGLLLSVSAKWSETFQPTTRWEKFRPLFLFNIGRLAGYFVLGGFAGVLGQSLTLSPNSTGILTVIVAGVMLVLGLNILRILPKKYCRIPLPDVMTRRIRNLSQSESAAAPILLGALTFFLPCGFTQSMQLLALGSGSFVAGGLIMLVFALGTLPALLGISVLSSVIEGRANRWFLSFSGAVVLLLGVMNLQSGLLLMGYDASRILTSNTVQSAEATDDPYVTIDDQGRQIMSMYVTDTGYSPNNFTIRPGLETWVYAIAKDGVAGCASFLVDATHNLQTPIKKGSNWLGPISKMEVNKDFVLTCSMGMLRANVHVRQS
ncbi:MAG: sulfite exporter TauE/SafE family protein [Candidatus Peribacteraceae bacterium]|nr:sulfite exporter TauE/SafE family protein [Candidatus Peribacteraceae bacterium]